MMEDGEFAQAARQFDRLAAGARRRGMPIQAANLALRAAQAYLAQDDVDTALRRMRRAIRVLARHGHAERVAQIAARADDELRERGYDAQAIELAQFADSVMRAAGLSLHDLTVSGSGDTVGASSSLPGRCSGCGAALVPADVTWHDGQTAECAYCGAVIKAT
jgi:hypothetical protein